MPTSYNATARRRLSMANELTTVGNNANVTASPGSTISEIFSTQSPKAAVRPGTNIYAQSPSTPQSRRSSSVAAAYGLHGNGKGSSTMNRSIFDKNRFPREDRISVCVRKRPLTAEDNSVDIIKADASNAKLSVQAIK